MGDAVDHLHQRAAILQEQIAQALTLARRGSTEARGLVATYQSLLASLYGDGLPLASLKDNSDIILHAEGPAARHHAAESGLVAWLCEEAERRLRQLTSAALRWSGSSGVAAQKDLEVLMNGLAPGSLYIGFSLGSAAQAHARQTTRSLDFASDDEVLARARSAIGNLVLVPRFVGEATVNAEIADAIEDPGLRDATLMAAYHLSPTGKRGVHTIEVSVPWLQERSGSFTNRERVVLRETAVRRPVLRRARKGTFVGELREVDLDAQRFQLRNVPTVGTLRCALEGLTVDIARKHIGKGVKVTGKYEANPEGKPGLMLVEKILPFQRQESLL